VSARGCRRPGQRLRRLSPDNAGEAAAVIQVRSNLGDAPRSDTVAPDRHRSDIWAAESGYDLAAYGPNGFLRSFKGFSGDGSARHDIRSGYGEAGGIPLHITNLGRRAAFVKIADGYSGDAVQRRVGPHESLPESRSPDDTHGWYNLTVTVAEDASFQWQLAGHVENGRDSVGDPALGARAD
jgi:phospholipase C